MLKQTPFSESVRAIFLNTEETRALSQEARCCLKSAIMNTSLTEEERRMINLLLYSVRAGRLSID